MSNPITATGQTAGFLSRPDIGIREFGDATSSGTIGGSVSAGGADLQRLNAGLGELSRTDPALARSLQDEVAQRLGPVDAGRFLSGIFDDLGDLIKHLIEKVEKAIENARNESKQGVDGSPATTAPQIGQPSSPETAPKTIVFSKGNQAIFDKQWGDSFPGGRSKEQGGTLVYDRKTGEISVQNIGGNGSTSGTFTPDNTVDDPSRYEVLGIFHTHPYDKTEGGFTGISFSGADAAVMINEGQRIALVQSGDKQFMFVRTDKTPFNVDYNKLDSQQNDRVGALVKQGYSFADASSKAAAELATKYGLAYYEGGHGKLTRVDP